MKLNAPLLFLIFLFVLCFSAGAIEHLTGITGNDADLFNRFQPSSWRHWLGTDELGRDVLIRLLYGGQVSLTVAVAAAMAAAVIGTLVGAVAGFAGGAWDAVLMRLTDVLIALPALPLLIILSALDPEKLGIPAGVMTAPAASLYKIAALIALLSWTTVARLARARALTLAQMDYVLAARALGVGRGAILRRHILPNLFNTVIVATTLAVGHIILMESVLSFLGLGIQPPMPSWGNMLTNAEDAMWDHASLTVYPGMMIFATVLAFNMLGDAAQDRLDPRRRFQGLASTHNA